MSKNKTKVCKVCGNEKPVGEFSSKGNGYYDYQCKVCKWFSKRNINYEKTNWNYDEDRFIIDSLLNERLSINEIAIYLNKDLKQLCFRITKDLKVSGITKLPLTVKCANCTKEFNIKPSEFIKTKNSFCSIDCHDEWQRNNPYKISTVSSKMCPICKKIFETTKHRKRQIYCSKECADVAKEDKLTVQCKICGRNIIVKRSMADKTATCSEECATENRKRICKEKSIKHTVNKICEYCGNNYIVKLSESTTSKCCSIDCRRKWFSEVYSQSVEWKRQRSLIAVESLSTGKVPRVKTRPQILLNEFLDELGISYINEYNCNHFAIDNFLNDDNLMIECMGTFWHADNRFYKEIKYIQQLNGVNRDIKKKLYIQSKYNIYTISMGA
ncbi:hypothetical protein ACR77J_08165 [Tissierella praeacuta]|uniref:hypothetical protein n=1 Tax=Tissierella praeacuta TaxID=43131 RepID=UPI003DA2DD62